MRKAWPCLLLCLLTGLPGCGPSTTAPPKAPVPPTAVPTTPTPALPTATPTPRGLKSPLYPVTQLTSAQGAPILFHPLMTSAVGVYVGIPFGRLDQTAPGQARQQFQALVLGSGLERRIADLGGELRWSQDPTTSELGLILPPEVLDPALEQVSLAMTSALTFPAAAPQDWEEEASLRRGLENQLLDAILVSPPVAPDPNATATDLTGVGAVVAVVGDLDESAVQQVATRIASWRGPVPGAERAKLQAPQQKVVWSLREEAPSAGLLTWIIPGGASQAVAWQGLAAAISAETPLRRFAQEGNNRQADAFFWPIAGDGVFGVYFEGENGSAPQFKERLVASLSLIAQGLPPAELERVHTTLRMSGQFSAQTPLGMAASLGRAQLRGSFQGALYQIEDGEALRPEDLGALAARLDSESLIAIGRGSAEEARSLALPPTTPTPVPAAQPTPVPSTPVTEVQP